MSLRITACALYNLYNDQLWLVWWDRLWILVLVKMCHQKHCLFVTGNQIWEYFQTKHIIIDTAPENFGEMSSKPQKSSWKPGSFELRFVITSSSALPVRLSFMIWKVQVNLLIIHVIKKKKTNVVHLSIFSCWCFSWHLNTIALHWSCFLDQYRAIYI